MRKSIEKMSLFKKCNFEELQLAKEYRIK